MANLNIPSPNPNNRPVNTYEWLGLMQKVFRELKGINWATPDTMSITQIIKSIDNDLNFKQTMHNTIRDAFKIAYTPDNILEKLKTVDGINSGLDADFIRGYVPVNKEGDSMSGFLTLHGDPIQSYHAATKQYVDSTMEGFIIKLPAKVATTENIELIGLQEIDGIPVVVDDRVLVKSQTDKKENGIYVVQVEEWIRSKDADTSNELKPGSHIFVNEGIINKDSSWVFTNDNIDVGVSDIEFSQFSGTGQITPGTGLAKDGNILYLTDTGVKAGTFTKINVDLQGRVTFGDTLIASDIPNLDWSKITTGKPTTVQGYGITNAVRTDIDNIINGNIKLYTALTGAEGSRDLTIDTPTSKLKLLCNHDGNTYIQTGFGDNNSGMLHITGYLDKNLSLLNIKVNNDNATINNNRILTTKDIGTGAGLDADKLDGLHSTSFMRTDANTSTTGLVTISKESTNENSALTILNPTSGDSAIDLSRTGSGLRHWRIKNAGGSLIFASKDDNTSYIDHVRIDTSSKQIYVNDDVVWNKGNDGSGSGLDADLLDGQQGSFYQNAANLTAGIISNARLSSSVFVGDNNTWSNNEETVFNYKRSGFKKRGTNSALIHYANPTNGGNNSSGIELSDSTGNESILNYYKLNENGSDIFRHKIWHSGQQGHSSGMDADTIDGKHFNDLNNLFVNVSGDTMTGFLKLHADPTEPLHAVTKQYVDGVVQGLDFKQSVVCATTSNLSKLEGLLTIDGVVLRQLDRVLVKNQTDKKQNGIYLANSGTWVRSSDANHISKLNIGAYIFIDGGVINKASGWVVDNITSGDIGVAEISFIQFSGTGQMVAGQGIGINGNEIYVTNTGITPGTYTKVTVNAQGRLTQGTSLVASDIPNLDWSKIATGKPTTVQGYGITNAVRTDASSTVNADLFVSDSKLKLKANTTDHTFLEMYARRGSNTRSAVIGYSINGSTELLILNEIGNTKIGSSSYLNTILGNSIFKNNVSIENNLPKLTLKKNTAVTPNTRSEILFECNEDQNMRILHSFLDTECPITNGNGITIESVGAPNQNIFLQVKGELYGGVDGTKKVFHTGNFNPAQYLPLSGGTMTGGLTINHNNGILIQSRLALTTQHVDYCKVGASDGDCYTLYNKNGSINLYTSKTTNGLLYNSKKVWHEANDGSGSGLDADLLDGSNSSVAPTANTIPKRGTDGSLESTVSKTNKVVLGNKAEIVYNESEKSIDFVIL